jgi:thiol:disulfide interchange protein
MARTDFWNRASQRALPVWLPVAVAVLIVARVISSRYEVKSPVDLVRWVAPGAAERIAKATKKPIFYEFSAEWCGPCHVLEDEVFRDPELAKLINDKFVPVKLVDTQREKGKNSPEVAKLESQFNVRVFPTIVVAHAGREPVIVAGYGGKERFEEFLRRTP